MTLSERQNVATFLEFTTVRPFIYFSYPYSFKCFYCTKPYSDLVPLLEHTSSHDTPNRTEMLQKILKKGKRTIKVDISLLKCKLCDKNFTDLDVVRNHLINTHGKEFTVSGNGMIAYNLTQKNGVISCHLCTKVFHTFFLLNKHINVHYNNAICETCGMGFISHKRLLQHKDIHLKRRHPCEKCKKLFGTVTKLKYHSEKVHGIPKKSTNQLKCPHCAERFCDHYKKLTHLRLVHNVTFTFECETCKATFRTRKALTLHTTKFHTQNILCDVCKKPFGERSILKKHMAMHTDDRNFVCPLCNKTYKYEKNLKGHMRVHNPDWKFACSDCWIGFPNKYEFKQHIKDVHSV